MYALRLSLTRESKLVDMKEAFQSFEKPVTLKLYNNVKRGPYTFTHLLVNTKSKGRKNIEAEIILQSTKNKNISFGITGEAYFCMGSEYDLHLTKV